MTPELGIGSASAAIKDGANPLHGQRFESVAAARSAAQDFEAFFLMQALQQMFAGVEQDSLFGGGPGEEMFKSMLVQEYSTELAKNGGIGIADQVLGELIRTQAELQP